jgi:hypothetical protein
LNETESLLAVEPLNCTCRHYLFLWVSAQEDLFLWVSAQEGVTTVVASIHPIVRAN